MCKTLNIKCRFCSLAGPRTFNGCDAALTRGLPHLCNTFPRHVPILDKKSGHINVIDFVDQEFDRTACCSTCKKIYAVMSMVISKMHSMIIIKGFEYDDKLRSFENNPENL